MLLLKKNLHQVWEQLRAKKPQLKYFLEDVQIRRLRGIADLRVAFNYPVSVIAGPNGCGKSTVLFACACAYDVPGRKEYVPSTLFPNLHTQSGKGLSDQLADPSFDYHYLNGGKKEAMCWRRGKSWNRSFHGRKDARQPQRGIYLRTLANLTSPSEIRSILQIGLKAYEQQEMGADLLAFAHRILAFRYRGLKVLQLKDKDLLFAERDDQQATYSEFHMSAGERAILRISKDISGLQDALILIDEIEAGMHPYTQQQIMLELQRLALRNNLQIIVTSHSSVILDSVPVEGRIFLERQGDNVIVQPSYRDIFQRAFYGQSQDKLSILCEDVIAEGLILGVLDALNPKINLTPDDISVGRNTGKEQFPQHVETLGKFQMLGGFVFVLDGDARSLESKIRETAARQGQAVQPLFLPGYEAPEGWIYAKLEQQSEQYADLLGLPVPAFSAKLQDMRQAYEGASDKMSNIIKNRFISFAESVSREPAELARIIGRAEAGRHEMKVFADELEMAIQGWRQQC